MGLSIFIDAFDEPYDAEHCIVYMEVRRKWYIPGGTWYESTVESGTETCIRY